MRTAVLEAIAEPTRRPVLEDWDDFARSQAAYAAIGVEIMGRNKSGPQR